MQSCIMHLDNVLGCQVDVGIMADYAGVLATQLHLDGNHASLHQHTLLAHFGRACLHAFVLVYVLKPKLLGQHILYLFHVWNSVRCQR